MERFEAAARRLTGHLRTAWPSYGVLIVSLLLTVLAWRYVAQTVEEQTRVRFEETVRATEAAIDRRTDAYLDAMFGARALFFASDSVERKEWESYVEGIEPGRRFEGLQALGYAEKVTPEEREAFLREARSLGVSEIELGANPTDGRVNFPVLFVGPSDEANDTLLGQDLHADPQDVDAMARARDTGLPEATGLTYVRAEAPPGSNANLRLLKGFAVYLPIYEQGREPETVAERREALRGFIFGKFKVADIPSPGDRSSTVKVGGLLDGVFGPSFDPGIDFEVYDGRGVGAGSLLYDEDGVLRAGDDERSLFEDERKIEVAGRDWTLYFTTLSAFERGAQSDLPAFVLANGVAVSLLLFGMTWMLVRSRVHAERTSRDLEDANRELEGTNRELEAFSYSVSHDLRAPLRSIEGFSQILLEDHAGELDEEGRDYLGRVGAASRHMARLIDDLLDLSRVGRRPLRREPVDMSALAAGVVEELREAQPDREVGFVVEEGLVAYGDENLLRVALENLLGNAWKFTSGKERATIEFGAIEDPPPGYLAPVYYVRDDGAGFDMRYAGKLFGAFQRLHGSGEFEGTGIGLATVARIVHRHGGRVWAEGAVGEGATFYFTLGSLNARALETMPKKAELA